MSSPIRGKKAQAGRLLAQNKIKEAKSLLEQICLIDRNDVESWISLIKINNQLGNLTAIEKCCRALIRLRPDMPEAHFHLGQTLLSKGRYAAAAEHLQHGLRFQQNNHLALFQLGKAYQRQRRFDEALALYRRALVLFPGFADAYDSICTILKSLFLQDWLTAQKMEKRVA